MNCIGGKSFKALIIILIILIPSFVFAQKGENSRILVHTLNYLSHDYQFAVKDGKIASKDEFEEMNEFAENAVKDYKDVANQWSDEDSAAIGKLVFDLEKLVQNAAPYSEVSKLALAARDKVLKASGLTIAPKTYPDLANGKLIFKTECAKCHGDKGFGDGPEGKDLEPQPRNFHDNERIRELSPFFAFNTIRLGVEGTGMRAHPTLTDEEVWDAAFYIMSLRYSDAQVASFKNDERIQGILKSLTVEQIATTSDDLFTHELKLTEAEAPNFLAAIRLNQPTDENHSHFINTSLRYLDESLRKYREKNYDEAEDLAGLSYLEGIEPIEMQLKASDPALMSKLESQIQYLRKMMNERKPQSEIADSIKAAKVSIGRAKEIMAGKQYSFWLAFMMSVSILLREGLEAFLVIMVILSVLKASNMQTSFRWIHLGWVSAILLGIVLWIVGGKLLAQSMSQIELIEGVIAFIAVAMLLYIGFWMHGKSSAGKWKTYVNSLANGAVAKDSILGLVSLSFFVVFREVFESVLFLSALNIESGNKHSFAIIFGVLAALVIIIALAAVVIGFSAKLPIPTLFKISSIVMGLLAVVLAGKGIHSFQETGALPIHGIPLIRIELLGIYPTLETTVTQLAVLVIVLIVWKIAGRGK
jgi:high-affinity iron transporter